MADERPHRDGGCRCGRLRFRVTAPPLVTMVCHEPGDWTIPFVETFTSEKLPWVTAPAVHSFPAFPPMEAWDGIVRAYRNQTETPPAG